MLEYCMDAVSICFVNDTCRLVRIAVSLAALTGTPLIITNVRGSR